MPTLAQLVRQKYPGAYDDMSDTDLEAKVDAKYPGAYADLPRSKSAPRDPESLPSLPAGMELAGTMAKGFGKAALGMVTGAVETGANLAGLGAVRDQYARVMGQPIPSEEAQRENVAHMRAAFAPGQAGTGERLKQAALAVPTVGPAVVGAVEGAKAIGTPAYKAMTGRVDTITPDEMTQAAEGGGGAIAGLATMSPTAVVKTLKFVGKGAKLGVNIAHFAHDPMGWVGKKVLTAFLHPEVVKLAGPVVQDMFVQAVETGNPAKAAAALAKAEERNPALAAAHAKAITEAAEAEAARIGEVTEGPQTVPAMAPIQPSVAPAAPAFDPRLASMRNTSKQAIAYRTAERTARQKGALAKSQAKAEAASSIVSTPVVEQALTTLEKRAVMPVKGNVTMANSGGGKPWVEPMSSNEVRIGIGSKDDPLGSLSAKITKDGVHVQQVTVIPSMRKMGLGASLYRQLGKLMKEKGTTKFLRDEMIQPEMAGAVKKLRSEALKEAGTKPIAGKPLTATERQASIKQLQAAVASDQDIWAAFGIEK